MLGPTDDRPPPLQASSLGRKVFDVRRSGHPLRTWAQNRRRGPAVSPSTLGTENGVRAMARSVAKVLFNQVELEKVDDTSGSQAYFQLP